MHTADWDAKELIPMPGEILNNIRSSFSQNGGYHGSNESVKQSSSVSQNGGYYGSSGGTAQSSSVSQNGGYYGSNSSATQSSSAPQNGGYYGPSGSNTQSSSSSSYYGNSTTNNNLAQNNSYYGSNTESKSGPMGGDFIAVPQLSKRQQKKANLLALKQEVAQLNLKRKYAATDGFERNTGTLAKRANRFSGAGGLYDASTSATTVASSIDKYMGKELIGGSSSKKLDENDYEHMKVKGTCLTPEKEYLRLTAPPKAERVRPQPILEGHLQNLIKERDSNKRREYVWFCSQFKALRQDLTVQRIFNEFAVRVYETHARVALEEKDLNEYNQCQTQLKELYSSLRDDEKALANVNEFIAYRIIYYVFLTGNKSYDGGSGDLFNVMLSLSPEQRQDPSIAHALKVRSAVADFDYHAFFRLQNDCPKRSMIYLMDFLVPTVRQWSLQRICKAYRPSVPVDFVLSELGFDKDEVELGSKWLESCGCVLSDDRLTLEAKYTVVRESDWKEQNSLI